VNLSEQNLNDEDTKIVIKEAIINKQCTELDLSKNKITSVGASIIAEALNNNTTLEWLYLSRNSLCDKGVHSLSKTLSLNNCKIHVLDLQRTSIIDEGAEYIAEMLKTNTTLRFLLLSYNEISDIGVQHLANVLTHHNTTLLSLCIDSNKLGSDSSVDALAKMLKKNRTLERLDIEDCNLSEKGKEKLRQIAQSKKDFELSV
jgi:Ran GTPase-activating protein (RanGAP) involved in mRNA processing and transport